MAEISWTRTRDKVARTEDVRRTGARTEGPGQYGTKKKAREIGAIAEEPGESGKDRTARNEVQGQIVRTDGQGE